MSDPNFEMSLSEFLGQWGFTMDDARNVAERLGIFNLEELKNLGDDFFYHVNNYHEEQRSLKQEADDEFKWSEEDRIKRGISTDDYYKLNESKASEDWEDEESERVQKALDKMNADAYMKQLTKKGYNEESKASEFNYNVLIKGKPSKEKLRDEFAPYVNIEDDGENTRIIFDGLIDGGKQELESLGYNVIEESKASEYSIKEEFDLQDQDGKYEMLSKADLSVADATNYSTYSHSELPEEVKDSLKGDEDSYGESWSRKSSIDKIEALERLGIKQGDAIKLSGVEFEDFGEDLQGALKGDVEDARNRMKAQKAFLNKTEDDQNPTGFNNQVGGEVDNPNSEFGQNYPDYNKIGESQTSMTKYECEHCNLGFKSNESLSRHHKSIHKIASEDIDGYSVDAGFTGQNSFTDMSSISKEDVTQEWWNNVATPSSKARILNSTGTPVENTFGLPSYYELTQETKAYLLGLDDFSFESKASEGQFDPNVADLWDESDMSERLKILSSLGITVDFDMAINGWSNLPLDVQITLEEINVAELRGESKANENKTYTCDKCGKVGDSFTDMAQEECPADVNANHQIPIFGDQVKPRGIGEEHYSMYFDQAYSDMNDENPITGLKQCEYCDAQFGEYDKQGMIDHANSHDADLDPVTGDSKESKASEAQIQCKECGGKGVTNWLGEDEMRCSVCAGTGVVDSEWEDSMDNEEYVYDAPIYIGTNKSWNESKASEGSEDVYNYEYVDDKVVCKNCGMKFDNAIDDARAMKDHSEIHESLYDKEAYAHEDDLDTLMWDNENPDDKGKQWKDKKGKKQESKASESILAGRSIEEYLQEYGMTREEGEQVAEYAGMDLKELIEIGNFDEARHHRVQDMDVSYMYENHPTEDEMDVLDPYRSYRKSPDKPQKTWDYRETDESKASEDITFADQHRGIQKDMIEFIRRRGGSASELDIDREFDLLNNFNNEYKHLQALKNDGTLTSAGWQPDNSGNDGYPDGSYIYNLNESYSSEAGLDDHSCPECGFITSDNSDYVDHLNAHED